MSVFPLIERIFKMEKRLTEVAMEDLKWQESAVGQMSDGWQFASEIESLSQNLIESVIAGRVSIKDLRAGVAWASALDKEGVAIYGVDISVGDQQLERLARRTMHHVGREALKVLKNSRRRTIVQAHANKLKI